MKSCQLRFANPDYASVDFKVRIGASNRRFGYFLLFINVLLVVFAFLISGSLIYSIKSGAIEPLCVLWVFVIFIMSSLYRLSKRYRNDTSKAFIDDPRSPVLYLRSFSIDSQKPLSSTVKKTPEEILETAFSQIGPLITVGDPREDDDFPPYLGAARLYISNHWRMNVHQLIRISSVVVISAECTESIIWELETAKKLVPPERLFISFLPNYDSENQIDLFIRFAPEFERIFETGIPLYDRHICFIDFDSYKRPSAINVKSDYDYPRGFPFYKVHKELSRILANKGLIQSTRNNLKPNED